jgi:uncharacterized protein (DUF488 family)
MTEVFTSGYEGLDPRRFFQLLQQCGIEMLVDVRDLPVSRKSGFSKAPLAKLCEQHEVEYRHVAELGCPRDVRHAYREDGDWARYTVRFKAYLAQQTEALASVARLVERFEEDFNFCHRTYVAEALGPLIGGDVRISHLTGPTKGRVVVLSEQAAA